MCPSVSLASNWSDSNAQDLARLLSRLESRVTLSEGTSDLQRSSYQRKRVGFNLNYARNLLLKIEHSLLASQSSADRKAATAHVKQQRAILTRLENRLFELGQVREDTRESGDDGLSSDEDTEELLRRYAPALQDTQQGIDIKTDDMEAHKSTQRVTLSAASTLEQTLRSRRIQHDQQERASATSTGRDTGLSSPPHLPAVTRGGTRPSNNETLMAHHSSEQDVLTTSLLSLASDLKSSTISFSESLGASNPLVDRATSSLDRNVGGMEAAERRMGMLRRMTEGKGWWARLGLYGWIGALWVVLTLIMFVMPKLRF